MMPLYYVLLDICDRQVLKGIMDHDASLQCLEQYTSEEDITLIYF